MNESKLKKPVLPHGWIVKQSSTYPDRVYYFNVNTGNSTWEPPTYKPELEHKTKQPPSKSCLTKPARNDPKTPKKSVSIRTPDPQFSPEAENNLESSDDDLLDLNDDGQVAEGHKYHMEILRGFESSSNAIPGWEEQVKGQWRKTENVTQNPSGFQEMHYGSSGTIDDHLACLQDVDMRQRVPPLMTLNNIMPVHSQYNSSNLAEAHPSFISQHNTQNGPFYAAKSKTKYNVDQTIAVPSPILGSVPNQNRPNVHCRSNIPPESHYVGTNLPQPFNSQQKNLSSSFRTHSSVHSGLLPHNHKLSSGTVENGDSYQNSMRDSDRFLENFKISAMYDTDLRKMNSSDRTDESKCAVSENEFGDERKRKLGEMWEAVKKIKCEDAKNDHVISVKTETDHSSGQKSKVLSSNDLRYKVLRKEGNKNNSMNQAKKIKTELNSHTKDFQAERDLSKPFFPKQKIKTPNNKVSDVRRVVTREGETRVDVKSEDNSQHVGSPVDNINNVTEAVNIDPDKLKTIQTWIDNLQPDVTTSFPPVSEEEDLKRTSPDSGVLSITYSSDADNRRIVVAGEKCGQTADSGISSVSTNTVFQPITDTWQTLPPLIHAPQVQPNNCWRGVHAEGAVVDHNRDVIEMEVDDNRPTEVRDIEDMEVVDIVVKEVRESLKNRPTEVVGMLTEMVSADTNSTVFYTSHKGLFIIVDTNVFIDHLNFIEDLRDQNIPAHGKPVLIVPWVVMQELDYLKSGKTASASLSLATSKKARDAVQFLFQCLQSNHLRVKGQTPVQAKLASNEFVAESNDDKILHCCLQCQKNNQDCLVVLLSNDKNLCNKSVISGIKAFTRQNILSELPTAEGIAPKISEMITTTENFSSPVSKSIAPVETRIPSPPVSTSKKADNDINLLDDVYCKIKSVIKDALSIILEREMKTEYGELWLRIVLRKPPWTLKDVLECFNKHWIAVFGQIYNRKTLSCVKFLLENFLKGHKVTWLVVEDIIKNAVELLNEDVKHKSCDNESSRYIRELLDLNSCRLPKTDPVPKSQGNPFHDDRRKKSQSPVGAQDMGAKPNRRVPTNTNRRTNRKSPVPSNRKSPVPSQSEIKLQQIWQTIEQFRMELNTVAHISDSPERHTPRLLQQGEKFVPAIKSLLDHYSAALNVPASETRSQLGYVIALCEQLNSFLDSVEIEDTEGPIDTYDLLDLFAAEDKRPILKKGHVQLKDFIKDIYTSLQQLPGEND